MENKWQIIIANFKIEFVMEVIDINRRKKYQIKIQPLPAESFGLILQNLKLICVIRTVQTYLEFWGGRLNFGITVTKIQPKVWERRRKRWREKMLNFDNGDTKFPVPNFAARVRGVPEVKRKKNWQTNCGNAIAENGRKKK